MPGPEVAPEAEGLAALVVYTAYLVAIGLLWVWRSTLGAVLVAFSRWAAGVTIKVWKFHVSPLAPLADATAWIDAEVDHALGVAADNTQRAALALFHSAAHVLYWIGDEIGGLAYDVAQRFERTATVTIPSAITRATHVLTQRLAAAERMVDHAISATIPAIQHRISSLDRARQAAEAEAAREAVTLKHDVAVVLPHEIAAADAWIGRTAKQARAAARRLANIEALLTVSGVAALVSVALSTLKLNWIKCPALGRIGKNHGCVPWHLLEDMLGGTFVALAATDVCKWSGLITGAAQDARPVLMEFVNVENALVGCHGAVGPPALSFSGYSPTPVVDGLTL